jgi:hypothetical protein
MIVSSPPVVTLAATGTIIAAALMVCVLLTGQWHGLRPAVSVPRRSDVTGRGVVGPVA